MADTRRALSALVAILNDNTSGDISAQDVRDVLVSVDGENSVQTGTFASIPVTGQKTGDLYVPSDGFCVYRWSGTAWVPWGPTFALREPTLETWAWINQGSASIATTNGGIHLSCTSNGGTHSHSIRKKSAPSTPYKCDFAFLPLLHISQYSLCGLVWRQSSDGKIVTMNVRNDSGQFQFEVVKYNAATGNPTANYVSNSQALHVLHGSPMFWRLEDDGTNRVASVSRDGRNYTPVHTVGRTDFMTADEVGFYVNSYDKLTALTLIGYRES